jgi:hypothetical protein
MIENKVRSARFVPWCSNGRQNLASFDMKPDVCVDFFIPQENGMLFELATVVKGLSACELHNEWNLRQRARSGGSVSVHGRHIIDKQIRPPNVCVVACRVSVLNRQLCTFPCDYGKVNKWRRNYFALVLVLIPCPICAHVSMTLTWLCKWPASPIMHGTSAYEGQVCFSWMRGGKSAANGCVISCLTVVRQADVGIRLSLSNHHSRQ